MIPKELKIKNAGWLLLVAALLPANFMAFGRLTGMCAAPAPAVSKRSPVMTDGERPVQFPKEWLNAGPSKGKADAPVTLVEFVDFNCPYCQKGAQTVQSLLQSTPTEVRLISKQHPLPMHPHAQSASMAALCAGRQGQYWQYRSEIFGEFWGRQSPDDLKAIASKLGLDRGKFDKCLDGAESLPRVRKDIEVAGAFGVRATPTYFVNGRRVVGANAAALAKLLEEASAPQK